MLFSAVILALHVLAVVNAASDQRWNVGSKQRWNGAINLRRRFPITPNNSTCIQPMVDHSALPPASSLASVHAVENACNGAHTKSAKVGSLNIVYTNTGSIFFNISSPMNVSHGLPLNAPSCRSVFNSMVATCLGNNYWGGWQLIQGTNWSISNQIYPKMASIPPATLSGTAVSSSALKWGASIINARTGLGSASTSPRFQSKPFANASSATSSATSSGRFGLASSAYGANSKQTVILNTSPTRSTSPINTGPTGTQSIGASTTAPLPSQMTKPSALSGTSMGTNAIGTNTGVAGSQSTLSTSSQANATQSIAPDSSILNAFAFPGVSTTTLSASNGAVLIYSKATFSDRATITGAPILVQTSLVETLKDGHTTRFIGGIWVGPGGVYWGPPGIPNIELGGIKPPCLWPFCSGRQSNGGGGGGAPGGIPPRPVPPPPPGPPPGGPNNNGQNSQNKPSTQGKTQTNGKSTLSSSDRQTSTKSSASSSRSSTSSSSSSSSSSSALSTVSLDEDPGLWPSDQVGQLAAKSAILADASVSVNDSPLWAPSGADESSDAADALLTYTFDNGDRDALTQAVSNSTRSTSFTSLSTSRPSLSSSNALAPGSFISPTAASKTTATTLVTTGSSVSSAAKINPTGCTLSTQVLPHPPKPFIHQCLITMSNILYPQIHHF